MRGRKPKSFQQQKNEGDPSKRGKHKLDERLASEPKPPAGLPSCPRHLKGRARSAWMFWSEELKGMKLDKRPDAQMLEGACWAYARAVEAELIRDRDGSIVYEKTITEDGEVIILKTKKHPAVEVGNRAWLLVRAFCSEFGLSPASRARLTIDKPDGDADADFMRSLAAPRVKSEGSPLVQ